MVVVDESTLRVLRATFQTTDRPLTTHEISQVAAESFGLDLNERQAAHWLGQLAKDGVVERIDEPCANCGGRGTRPKWRLL